jgi:hypothetical protein
MRHFCYMRQLLRHFMRHFCFIRHFARHFCLYVMACRGFTYEEVVVRRESFAEYAADQGALVAGSTGMLRAGVDDSLTQRFEARVADVAKTLLSAQPHTSKR